jgi:hypothetical protein
LKRGYHSRAKLLLVYKHGPVSPIAPVVQTRTFPVG